MTVLKRAVPAILVFVLLLSIAWLGYFTAREYFQQVAFFYVLAFGAYAVLIWKESFRTLPMFLLLGLLLRIVLFASDPAFTDDHHRFIWDGQLVAQCEDPYTTLPSEMDATAVQGVDPALYEKLNSKEYYSVYPPVLQYIFGASAWFAGEDREANIKLVRLFVLLAEMISIWILFKLLEFWKQPTNRTAIYALNPLVVVELTGNLHAEAFMVCFTLLALFLLVKGRRSLSAVAMGFAVCTKLWPLFFLPFLVKRIGWAKAMVYGLVTLATAALLFLPFWSAELVPNFLSSVRLYFGHFEYNASVYALLRSQLGPTFLSEYSVMPILTLIALAILFVEDLLSKTATKDLRSWPIMMLWALALYMLFATTVHPWYVLPMLAFSVFSKYRWPLIWTVILPITYFTYAYTPWQQNYWVITLEYLLVIGFLLAELNTYAVWPWWSKFKARGKVKLLLPWTNKEEKLLEVGAGKGALTLLLREAGVATTALDKEDRSHFEDVRPVLANAVSMPFVDKQFDTVQLITMLHHTPDPNAALREAARVGKRIIVMEDVYSDLLQKYLTFFVDSLANMEFKGHPHTNRSDAEWKRTFEALGLELMEQRSRRVLLCFRQEVYLLNTGN